jgi:hypothetical protein
MAYLREDFLDKFGHTNEQAYEIIVSYNVDVTNRLVTIYLHTYTSAEARDNKVEPIHRSSRFLRGEDYEQMFGENSEIPAPTTREGDNLKVMYETLNKTDDFQLDDQRSSVYEILIKDIEGIGKKDDEISRGKIIDESLIKDEDYKEGKDEIDEGGIIDMEFVAPGLQGYLINFYFLNEMWNVWIDEVTSAKENNELEGDNRIEIDCGKLEEFVDRFDDLNNHPNGQDQYAGHINIDSLKKQYITVIENFESGVWTSSSDGKDISEIVDEINSILEQIEIINVNRYINHNWCGDQLKALGCGEDEGEDEGEGEG